MMNIGYHVSISKALNEVAKTVKNQGLKSIQIFSGNPRTYFPSKFVDVKPIKDLTIPKYVHINYLVNLADNKPVIQKSLIENLQFCDSINADGLVVHMGSNENKVNGMLYTIDNIRQAYKTGAKTKMLIETTAEGGNKFKLEYIIQLLNENKELNIGMCLDTCHVYAAGYDVAECIEKYHDLIDLIHLNNPDEKVVPGGHLDRHNVSLFDKTARFSKEEVQKLMDLIIKYNKPAILETGDQYNDFLICEKYGCK